MNLGASLRTLLANDGTIAAAITETINDVSTVKIYPLIADANASLPYIIYMKLRRSQEQLVDDPSGLIRRQVRFDVWAKTDEGAQVLADAVAAALNGYAGNMTGGVIQLASLLDESDMLDLDASNKTATCFGRQMLFEVVYNVT
jgi:hypothetical protein